MKADPRSTLAFSNFFCGGFFYCFKKSNLSDISKKMGTADWKTAFWRLVQDQCGKAIAPDTTSAVYDGCRATK